MKKYILLFILLFSFTYKVNAECNDNDLLTYANNVSLKYKLVSDSDIDYLYYLYIDPKRDDIELRSTNSLFSGVTKSMEIEGNLAIPSLVHFEEKEYTVDIYVKSNNSVCSGELLTTLKYTVPPYNNYANTQFCEENPDLDMCQTMYDNNDVSNEEFALKVEEYLDEKEKEENKSFLYTLFFDYLIWFLVPALIIGFIYYRKIHKVKKVKENA